MSLVPCVRFDTGEKVFINKDNVSHVAVAEDHLTVTTASGEVIEVQREGQQLVSLAPGQYGTSERKGPHR